MERIWKTHSEPLDKRQAVCYNICIMVNPIESSPYAQEGPSESALEYTPVGLSGDTLGGVAAQMAEQLEQLEQFGGVKEMLHGQKANVLAGYAKFTKDLGEETLGDEDYDKTLAVQLEKWTTDGSLAYLQEWLGQNPGHKIYLSASPSREIERKELVAAAHRFGADQALPTVFGRVRNNFGSNEYYIGAYGNPAAGNDGEALPVSLTVWTDMPNMEEGKVFRQQQALRETQRTVGSAAAPSPLQTLGFLHTLRQSDEFGGAGALFGEGVRNATITRLINTPLDEYKKRVSEMFVSNDGRLLIKSSDVQYGDPLARFVIG